MGDPRTDWNFAALHGPRSHHVLFWATSGSHAHGLQSPQIDVDTRGIFAMSARDQAALAPPPELLSDARGDHVFYSLKRTLVLLAAANPNALELLYLPADCIRQTSPEMQVLVANRQLFVTSAIADTFVGYARTQLKRARGQNKWVNNPRPEQAPTRAEFCRVVPRERMLPADGIPMRPISLTEAGWELDQFRAAALEATRGVFRLYHYGPGCGGVFRDDNLVCSPIPLEDEAPRFAGLLLYQEEAYRHELAAHHHYWKWRAERNEARWRPQEGGTLDYDPKNLMHTLRLLLSGRHMLRHGEPLVRVQGEERTFLLEVRSGRFRYGDLVSRAEEWIAECQALGAASRLPTAVDPVRLDALFAELTDSWEERTRCR